MFLSTCVQYWMPEISFFLNEIHLLNGTANWCDYFVMFHAPSVISGVDCWLIISCTFTNWINNSDLQQLICASFRVPFYFTITESPRSAVHETNDSLVVWSSNLITEIYLMFLHSLLKCCHSVSYLCEMSVPEYRLQFSLVLVWNVRSWLQGRLLEMIRKKKLCS